MEIWKDIPSNVYYHGIKPGYQVSNFGRVRNGKTGKILAILPGQNGGQSSARVSIPGLTCHNVKLNLSTLVWNAFSTNCNPVSETVISFKDKNPDNCALSNLYIEPRRFN